MSQGKIRLGVAQDDTHYDPDGMMLCDPRYTDRYFKRYPERLIKVLSDSTEVIGLLSIRILAAREDFAGRWQALGRRCPACRQAGAPPKINSPHVLPAAFHRVWLRRCRAMHDRMIACFPTFVVIE